MRHIGRNFVGVGIIAALVGMIMGITMGMREDFALAPVHAHINLVGWATLVLFGLGYHVGIAKNDGWAAAHFWIAVAGAILLPVGIWVVTFYGQPLLVGVGALLTLVSMALFGVNFLRARGA